jgi:hypothetical protein
MNLGYHNGKPNIIKSRYIENIQLIGINEIITDIKLVHATNLIFAATVKSESRKIWSSINQKGKSMFQIHPSEL